MSGESAMKVTKSFTHLGHEITDNSSDDADIKQIDESI